MIDLRSDTVTRPSAAMRRAMAEAEVGDDVLGEDPTVRRLEEAIAELLEKPAGLFVPSGTMSNQVAIRVHTRPGDELICEQESHIFVYEGGGPAALSGVTCRTVAGRRGILDRCDIEHLARPEDIHQPRSSLLCIENTHNRGGGSVQPIENLDRMVAWAHANGLATHLDGARLFNAAIASRVPAARIVRGFATVSVCFSKGMGAPVGSALVGTVETIARARRIRKLFGGGMRQAGILAAAGLFALEHHLGDLEQDHIHARRLADALAATGAFALQPDEVETNIVWARLRPERGRAEDFVARLASEGVLALSLGPGTIRMVTHRDISSQEIDRAAMVIARAV